MATWGDNSISVIDGDTYKNLKNITFGFGHSPTDIVVDVNKVYVATSGDNTISVK